MVEKIVLVIDRDDDLGYKTSIKSPVVGRENVIEAAVRLATTDPEDSDVNTMFAAIKTYDELKQKGEDVEVVVVCGDRNVGVVSDSKIAEQLDEIDLRLKPRSTIVVTDGSEDEFVLPVISSRFKIDSIERVVVKQSRTIESTYFLIRRMLNDPKVARITLAPLGMIFLVYSIFLIFQHPEWGLGGIILFLGMYFLSKAYGWDRSFAEYMNSIRQSLLEGRFSFILYVTSGILLVVALIQGVNSAASLVYASPHVTISTFIFASVWWFVLSGIFAALAKASDAYAEGRSTGKYFSILFLLISFGFVVWGASGYILTPDSESAMQKFAVSIIASILIALVGVVPLRRS
jgi:putative membrane protein